MTDASGAPQLPPPGSGRRRARHVSTEGPPPGAGLVATGTVLFLVGLVAVVVAVVPVLVGTARTASDVPAIVSGVLLPLGLGLALGGVLRSARARRRAARRRRSQT